MSYAEEVQKARRQAILLALYFSPGYTGSLPLLRTQIDAAGYVASLDLVQTEIAWLAEQGLVSLLPDGAAARLTARGEDIALGRSQSPGVRRPSPGEVA